MSNVVSIEEARPHLAGKAVCLHCRYEFVAVAPVGEVCLDCPECGARTGARMNGVLSDGPHWTCSCGNQFFLIPKQGDIYCGNCGLSQVFP